jgi:haloalkane dehalogenase
VGSHTVSHASVLDRRMAYAEAGTGDPIVLVHGNPTSSFLWRNVMPHVAGSGWCVAPDLIGMGESDKLPDSGPGSYRFVEHRRYVAALLESLGITGRVTLVGHDWGSALVFDWAHRHPEAVRGIAYMEALVAPPSFSVWPEPARPFFEALRSDAGEEMCLEKNLFVERVLPASVLRDLTPEEMAAYRAPYRQPGEGRRPTLTWPREIPFDGEPADVHEIASSYSAWLGSSPVPKLYVRADPGFLTSLTDRVCRDWPEQEEVTVRGHHFLQEDSPDEIGAALADWIDRLP